MARKRRFHDLDSAEVFKAFGETKTVEEWSADPRCAVSLLVLRERIRRGVAAEPALTMPAASGSFGLRTKSSKTSPPTTPSKRQRKLYAAFGEDKSIGEWSADPRCAVCPNTLQARLHDGWPAERAITTAPVLAPPVERLVTAYGETKNLTGWLSDPRCGATRAAMQARIRKGLTGEAVLTGERIPPVPRKVSAFGEEKSVSEWMADPRMAVSYGAFITRLRKGYDPEYAITRDRLTEEMALLTAWGETKHLVDWSRDPRCSVKSHTLLRRIENWKGAEPEFIVSAPSKRTYRFQTRRLLTGWGETKEYSEWLDDPRRIVYKALFHHRLKEGWSTEDALTVPVGDRKGGRPPTNLYEAFGEKKGVREWANDPRCVTSVDQLYKRLASGWEVERALTVTEKELRSRRRRDGRAFHVTAFGTTKTARDWADDKRCSVHGDLIVKRVRNGWTPEEAITKPARITKPPTRKGPQPASAPSP